MTAATKQWLPAGRTGCVTEITTRRAVKRPRDAFREAADCAGTVRELPSYMRIHELLGRVTHAPTRL